jgi:DNA-directed RNA polymerase subunit beta'
MDMENYKDLLDLYEIPENNNEDWFDGEDDEESDDETWDRDDAFQTDEQDDLNEEMDKEMEESDEEEESEDKKSKKDKKSNEDFFGLWQAAKNRNEDDEDENTFEEEHHDEKGLKSHYKDNFASATEKLIQSFDDYRQVKIKIASPEEIKRLSHGEIQNSETLNYRTLKSEFGGLFCDRIFGPSKSFECYCGIQYAHGNKETFCEKCKVPIEHTAVRRERIAHISLPVPAVNPLFINHIHLFLDVSSVNICKIINFELYIVTNPGLTKLEYKQLLNETEYAQYKKTLGDDTFMAETGSEAIYKLLKNIDLQETKDHLESQLNGKMIDIKRRKTINLLKYINSFIKNRSRPEYMVFIVVPVLPAGLRPLVQLDNGKFVSSDLNDKYRSVVHRVLRLQTFLKKLAFIAPEEIVNNEKRMLAQSIVNLIVGDNKNPTQKSIFTILQGKTGLLRNKMLGKRNDFTARAVITVSHKLKIDECGIPKKILKELFRPYLYRLLKKYGIAVTTTSAKHLVDIESKEIWGLLEEILKDRYVLLNRAPTLYSLGIQAFRPKIIENNAIQISPLVCRAFNADFDGDQMSVHVPLFLESQLEAKEIMSSRKNVLSPVSGKVIIAPSKDMILGLYCMTFADPKGEKSIEKIMHFANMNEVEQAIAHKIINMNDYIYARYEYMDDNGVVKKKCAVTNAGRLKIWSYVPLHPKINFEFINRPINKGIADRLLDDICLFCGKEATVVMAEAFKDLGFEYAFKSGVTLGRKFIDKIDGIDAIKKSAWSDYVKYEDQYNKYLITKEDKNRKILLRVNDAINQSHKELDKWLTNNPQSSTSLIIKSGARGSIEQLRQMVIFRGLGLDIKGAVGNFLCINNYCDGLRAQELYDGAHGARKGAKDRAVSVATGGYLQRKMIDVAQSCTIVNHDCGSTKFIKYGNVISGGLVQSSLGENILGRVCGHDILDPKTGNVVVAKNTLINKVVMAEINKHNIHEAYIRSPVFCNNNPGVCSLCYGVDTSSGKLVNIGKAVGVIAAQSIGEPGSQMTMRTFQSGSVAKGSIQDTIINTGFNGFVHMEGDLLAKGDYSLVISGTAIIKICDEFKNEICKYFVPYGSRVYVHEGQAVSEGDLLVEIDDVYDHVYAVNEGFVKFENLINKVNYEEKYYEDIGFSETVVIDNHDPKYNNLVPTIVIVDEKGKPKLTANGQPERHYLSTDMILLVKNGDTITIGQSLAKVRITSTVSEDIVDGLTKVINLLEARQTGDIALLSPVAGRVHMDVEERYRWKLNIINDEGELLYSSIQFRQQLKRLLVRHGDKVNVGDVLISGVPSLHDILNIMGLDQLVYNFINSIQSIYKEQGAPLSNQHLEILLKQMLRMVEVTDKGDSNLINNDYVDISLVNAINDLIVGGDGKPVEYKRMIIGIIQAAVKSPSFLSAASFQETQKIFKNAALEHSVDYVDNLKSCVILAKLIKAGTGVYYYASEKHARQLKEKQMEEKKSLLNTVL